MNKPEKILLCSMLIELDQEDLHERARSALDSQDYLSFKKYVELSEAINSILNYL